MVYGCSRIGCKASRYKRSSEYVEQACYKSELVISQTAIYTSKLHKHPLSCSCSDTLYNVYNQVPMSVLFDEIDKFITHAMARFGIPLLRYSIGLIFIWFGALKYVPGLSPAQELATSTIDLLTFGLIPLQLSLILLATLEVLIGVLIVSGKWIRLSIFLLFFQMAGTLTPVFLFPELVFTQFPYALTMEGQYIFKNFVVISAALVIGATARGGLLVPEVSRHDPLRRSLG